MRKMGSFNCLKCTHCLEASIILYFFVFNFCQGQRFTQSKVTIIKYILWSSWTLHFCSSLPLHHHLLWSIRYEDNLKLEIVYSYSFPSWVWASSWQSFYQLLLIWLKQILLAIISSFPWIDYRGENYHCGHTLPHMDSFLTAEMDIISFTFLIFEHSKGFFLIRHYLPLFFCFV